MRVFSWWRGMNKLSASGGGTPHRPLSTENHACCNLFLQLRVSIHKTNNLQKEKGFPRSVWVMEFQSSMFLQLKLRNVVNFQKFIFTFHSHTDKYVEMISTSHDGTLKQSRSPRFKTTGWLQGQPSLSSYRGRSIEYQELLQTWELNGKKETVFWQWLYSLETVEPYP